MNTTKMLTSKDMMALFGVSHMTIHHWRDRLALPIKQEKGSRNVYFDSAEVRRWAKDQGMKCTVEEVNQILAKRDGRKPTTKAKPAKPKATKQASAATTKRRAITVEPNKPLAAKRADARAGLPDREREPRRNRPWAP